MKYFVDATARVASGHENYIEFRKPGAVEDFWDADSLYIAEDVMRDSGFEEFWNECATKHDFGFMDTIYAADWSIMVADARRSGGVILEMVNELSPWLEAQYATGAAYVGVVSELERALDRRRQKREAYQVDPKFYEEVKAIDHSMPIPEFEAAYEELLRKYNMPSCFFPLPLNKPGQWE